jgi:hypothetical protein
MLGTCASSVSASRGCLNCKVGYMRSLKINAYPFLAPKSLNMPTSPSVLRASLEAHNDSFETLLNLIPAKYYVTQEVSEDQVPVTRRKGKKKRDLSKVCVFLIVVYWSW